MKLNQYKLLSGVASGRIKADTVLKNANVINVFSNRIINCDIAICDGIIAGLGTYSGYQEIDLKGKLVAPGFIDAHIHLESSMLTPMELIKNIVSLGTTTYIADPHEAVNVKGAQGLDFMISQTENIPSNVYIMLPSCVPALEFECNGATFDCEEMKRYIDHPRVLGLGEVMNYPAVINGEKDIYRKLSMFKNHIIDGHAPGLSDNDLNAYVASGIHTDHESNSFEYALKEIERGLHVHIREGSAAKNLDDIVSGIIENNIPTENFSFCTDDKHIEEIRKEGHINYCIKRSIKLGLNPIDAIKMATINTAKCYGLKHLGAIAPGYQADLVIFDNFEDFNIESVYHKGKNSKYFIWQKQIIPLNDPIKNTINISSIYKNNFSLKLTSDTHPVINIIKNKLFTIHTDEYLPQKNGFFRANQIYNKIAIIERHKNTGLIGIAAVKNFNLNNGAIASSIAHDSHNISVIGDNNADMLIAVLELQKNMGGITIVSNGRVIKTLPLPLMGLMSEKSFEEVNSTLQYMIDTAHTMGVPEEIDPFLTLAFISLPVIPEIRITPRGLFDVVKMEFM
ncbi:MAG: adenine deaminase [Proteocatella sp.]